MGKNIEDASDRPVIVADFTLDALWREIQQALMLACMSFIKAVNGTKNG
jgi:hypothetical protein